MKYQLEVMFDHDTERPDEYALGQFVSFSNRHHNYTHPNAYSEMDCPACDGFGVSLKAKETGREHCEPCDSSGVIPCTLGEHPDVLAVLSYYEHGLCKWMVGPSTVSDYGGFDTANVAGVIVWNGENNEREWWDGLGDERRKEILDGLAEEYTDWCNGNCFGYQLVELETCETCDHVSEGEEVDSCWGYIGSEWFSDTVSDMVHGFNIDPADIRVTGEAADYVIIREKA